MDKYKILKELINQWIDREMENMRELKELKLSDTVGFSMAMGAHDAYRQVLRDISELEQEVACPE